MKTKIIELQVIFQKPVNPFEVPDIEALYVSKVFATQGQTEVYKYVQTSKGDFVENHLEIIPVNIPTGLAGMKNVVRVAILRLMKETPSWDPNWIQFYCIAKFEGIDGNGRTEEFFRTIIPRTEINVQVRNLRRGNVRHRKHGSATRRGVRRKKL